MERELTVEETQRSYRRVQQELRLENGTEEERDRVKQRLTELEDELAYIIGDRGFEEYVSERLAAYQRELDDNTALCSCWRSTCPLKRGVVPEAIRQHGTSITGRRPPSELVAEWLQRHEGGEALAMIRKEWAQMLVRVHVALDDAKKGLSESEYLPSQEEMARNAGLAPPDGATDDEPSPGVDGAEGASDPGVADD